MKWIDLELMGDGWVLPHKAKHPDLGEVWIGGTSRKHVGRTPPARYIETEALRNANFVMYAASQFPKVEFGEVKVTPATDDLYWVEVEVKNDKAYPTSSDRAVALKRAVMDKITVSGGGGRRDRRAGQGADGRRRMEPGGPERGRRRQGHGVPAQGAREQRNSASWSR